MNRYIISEDLVTAILRYLGTCPYEQVHIIVGRLQQINLINEEVLKDKLQTEGK